MSSWRTGHLGRAEPEIEAGPDPAEGGGPESPPSPWVRWLVRLSPAAAVPAGVVFFLLGAPVRDVVLLSLLLVSLPLLAVAQALLLRTVPIEKMPAYLSTVLSITVLAGVCSWAGAWNRGWASLGLLSLPGRALLGWTLVLTGLGLLVLLAFRWVSGALGIREHPSLRRLLPHTLTEKAAFTGVSLSAGVGEELVYRGYALAALAPVVGLGPAVVLSTVSFGVVHAYQGLLGFFRTAALGGLLVWGYLASGSLLPAMAAHAFLDILAGIVLAERLMVPEPESGV